MPIKFRCPHCQQFLGISRSKAGSVSDCPNCGMTIRIPNLDGKVAPLPKPKMNLKDNDLRKALNALASLDPATETASEHGSETPSIVENNAPAASVSLEPVVLEVDHDHLEPMKLAEPVAIVEPAATSHPSSEMKPRDELAVLAELADAQPVPQRHEVLKKRRGSGGVLLLAVLVSLICGGILGRALFPTVTGQETAIAPEAADPQDQAQQAAVADDEIDSPFVVQGKVEYETETGTDRADVGARVLILPMERNGSAKLSVNGFRIGASSVDRAVLNAEVTALGGVVTNADANGAFSAKLPTAGPYGVLIASKFQSDPGKGPLIPRVREFAQTYFERSHLLVGQLKYHFQSEELVENKPITIDVTFPKD